jgi:CRISPR-associated endonuclease Cas2
MPEGKKRARYYFLKKKIIRPKKKWDGKWRVVIFDISEDKKPKREKIREWLKNIGLKELQKSVYVYPFDFKSQLNLMTGILAVPEIKYMVCDIIEGEEELIDDFFESEILNQDDLVGKKK